jgi:hypothetical protein
MRYDWYDCPVPSRTPTRPPDPLPTSDRSSPGLAPAVGAVGPAAPEIFDAVVASMKDDQA